MTELQTQALAEHLYAVYYQFVEDESEANLDILTSACALASIMLGLDGLDTTEVWNEITSVYALQPARPDFVAALTRRWSKWGEIDTEEWFFATFGNNDWEDDV